MRSRTGCPDRILHRAIACLSLASAVLCGILSMPAPATAEWSYNPDQSWRYGQAPPATPAPAALVPPTPMRPDAVAGAVPAAAQAVPVQVQPAPQFSALPTQPVNPAGQPGSEKPPVKGSGALAPPGPDDLDDSPEGQDPLTQASMMPD